MNATATRPQWELADVVRLFGASLEAKRLLPIDHYRVLRHIDECRTAALGGHLEKCDACGFRRPVYNSCGDRHCPKCQTLTKERWLLARLADLLPVVYHHAVFTLPHELNALVLANKRVMLDLLFRAVAETLLQFGRDPRSRLGGQVGFTLVLHTWNQLLESHFHLHCVIPAGALSEDGTRWIEPRHEGFLFSVDALAIVFRGKFLDHLARARASGKLHYPGQLCDLAHPVRFDALVEQLRSAKWVVYSKPALGGPAQVLEYLGRYTHRVAISNHRLVNVSPAGVTFSYRDRKVNAKKTMTLPGTEFLSRFLLHVLPDRFMRIRHYGFLANSRKRELLAQCRAALAAPTPQPPPKRTAEQLLLERAGIDILACPCCGGGRMVRIEKIEPAPKRRRAGIDTS